MRPNTAGLWLPMSATPSAPNRFLTASSDIRSQNGETPPGSTPAGQQSRSRSATAAAVLVDAVHTEWPTRRGAHTGQFARSRTRHLAEDDMALDRQCRRVHDRAVGAGHGRPPGRAAAVFAARFLTFGAAVRHRLL